MNDLAITYFENYHSTDFLLFFGSYIGYIVVAGFVVFFIWNIIDTNIYPYEILNNIFFLLVFFCIIIPFGFFILDDRFNLHPPDWTNGKKVDVRKNKDEIKELSIVAEELAKALSNPGDLTIKRMQSLLEEAVDLSTELTDKAQSQQKMITRLIDEVANEKEKAEESKRLAQQVTSIAKEKLEAVKLLITEDAKQEATKSFLYGALISFPIGILTSLLASFLYRRMH